VITVYCDLMATFPHLLLVQESLANAKVARDSLARQKRILT